MSILDHEGRKYLRLIYSSNGLPIQGDIGAYPALLVDVYDVIESFGVRCPALQHCLKKLLCAGQRNKGDILDDLNGAKVALLRAIELEEVRIYLDMEQEPLNLGEENESQGEPVREDSMRPSVPLVDPKLEGTP